MPPLIPNLARAVPLGQAHQYQTYTIRDASDRTTIIACAQVGCPAWTDGWESVFDESDACGSGPGVQCVRVRLLGAVCGSCGAQYIRLESGRDFTEQRTGEGLTVFRFAAHQRCFREHRTAPRAYIRRGGDWRGNPLGTVYRHSRPEDWAEDFAANQDRLARAHQRG